MPWRYAGSAEDQVDQILLDSAERWGIDAAARYHRLILAGLGAVDELPHLLGSNPIPRLPGVRSLHLRLVRHLVMRGERVRQPRHLIVYRVGPGGVVEILGLVHDRMRLATAARRVRREADS